MKKFISLNGLLSFLLFFAVSFIAIFYQCANAEYNLKEQIDRGYISRNAVFFTFDNPAEITEEEYTVVIDSDTNSILVMSSSYSFDLGKFGNMNIAEYDMDGNLILPEESADLAADNSPDANGQTLIMNLLSGGKGSYFAAVHAGTGRYVYYQGDPELPPMTDGRFFTPKECVSDEKLAVIGKDYLGDTFKEDDQTCIMYRGERYRVIGTAGLTVHSTLDSLIFVNLGSVSPEEQMNGRFYIDGDDKTVNASYWKMSELSCRETGMALKKLTLPTTVTDIVSGGTYMSGALRVLVFSFLILLYISILYRAILSAGKRTGAMMLAGVSKKQIIWRIYRPMFFSGLAGILISLILSGAALLLNYFYLPANLVLREIFVWIAASLLLLLAGLIPLSVYIRRYTLQEALRES